MAAIPVVDLTDVAVVDNHCHSVERRQDQRDVGSWRGYFSESPDPEAREEVVATTACYQRVLSDMAAFHGVEPTEAAVLEARATSDGAALAGRLLRDAYVGGLVVDTGFPDPATALSVSELAAAGACRAVPLLRLEPAFADLVARSTSLAELLDAVRHTLADARGQGWHGFKSVVGYRTGLAVERWDADDQAASFARARAEAERTGEVRLGHKPLLDTLLHVAFAQAAAQELPVQVHVGYGDPDADLRLANPLLLRAILEEPAYRGMALVLLHGCWPYVREGAYLAAVYGNAWLDVSYGIPFLSRGEMRRVTRAALGAAPARRLLASSDGARIPELHWTGARDARRLLAEALGELVADGDLDPDQARRTGEQVLRDNAWALYDLGSAADPAPDPHR